MKDSGFDAVYAIIAAAGKGRRMCSDIPKQLLPYGGSSVLGTVLRKFLSVREIDRIFVLSPSDGSLDKEYAEIVSDAAEAAGRDASAVSVVRGGRERGDSVKEGLKEAAGDAASKGLDPDSSIVLIHDAARPGIETGIIEAGIDAMRECRAVSAAVPATDSIRMIKEGMLKEYPSYPIMMSACVDRRLVYRVQTPQIFRLSDILTAYDAASRDGFTGTDDASVAEHAGIKIALIPGSASNIKITTREDLRMSVRTGSGYDVHRLVPDRPLILCGTPIPGKLGLDGHSDADVAAHALMDALLGAAGLGDIGRYFPDSDDRYKGADSMELLRKVREMLGDAVINNVDITIIAEKPKLAPYSEEMRRNISKFLGISRTAVNVKATTEEGLGFTGSGEGIAAFATCSIEGSF